MGNQKRSEPKNSSTNLPPWYPQNKNLGEVGERRVHKSLSSSKTKKVEVKCQFNTYAAVVPPSHSLRKDHPSHSSHKDHTSLPA